MQKTFNDTAVFYAVVFFFAQTDQTYLNLR